ncbi:hypothetical protein Hdeb2414_s0005g00161521 [Helianthus debilis subsp. tardiflorus]
MTDDSASVTTSCLAIGEKRPRRSGGCVGIFFQLFDWNRRFSKKKFFPKRLLPVPPDRAKEASKLLQIADAPQNDGVLSGGNNISAGNNGGQAPTLVARLMGLESMPSVQQIVKHSSGEHDELDANPNPKATQIQQDFRPQKVQKTGTSDRRSVTRFGAEALQLKNVLTRSRKHHYSKLASPVPKSRNQSRRNSSRLIGAATRVLESGLQGRQKSKYVISYGARNRMNGENENENVDVLSQQACCKNCGSLIDVSECKSKVNAGPSTLNSSFDQEQELQPRNVASRDYVKGNTRRVDDVRVSLQSKDFVALNRSLTGQTRSRIPGKVDDKFDKRGKLENGPSHWQKRRTTRNGPRMASNAQAAGKQIGSEAFRFNSQMKNRSETPVRLERRKNNKNATSCKPSDQKISLQHPFPLTGDCLSALVEEKLQELTSRVGYDLRTNVNPPKRTPVTSFQDLLCALSTERQVSQKNMEVGPKRNHLPPRSRCRFDHNTRFCLQTKLQKAEGLIANKNSDHLSPGSVLEASFSNDSCCSSSFEDNSGRTQHAVSISYSFGESQFQESEMNIFYSDDLFSNENTCNELVVDLVTYISQVLSTIEIVNSRITGNTLAHIKHVVFNSELVLSNQIPHNPTELNSFFICDLLLELDALADVIWTTFGNFLGSQNAVAGYQLKQFVFDAVIEYLESKFVKYSKCGFVSWIDLPQFTDLDGLVHEIVEEVRRWMGLVGVTSDELVERDMSLCLGKWTDFEVEVYETGAKIESDIMQMLVDEIVVDC